MTETRPFHHHPSPGLAKARACLAMLAASGVRDEEATHAALFLAEASHVSRYGRPLYGETWVRGDAGGQAVTGLLARALMVDDEPSPDTVSVLGATSQSDREALVASALEVDAAGTYATRDRVRASPLFGRGAAGTPVDLLDGLPPRADRAETAFMWAHSSFGPGGFD